LSKNPVTEKWREARVLESSNGVTVILLKSEGRQWLDRTKERSTLIITNGNEDCKEGVKTIGKLVAR